MTDFHLILTASISEACSFVLNTIASKLFLISPHKLFLKLFYPVGVICHVHNTRHTYLLGLLMTQTQTTLLLSNYGLYEVPVKEERKKQSVAVHQAGSLS